GAAARRPAPVRQLRPHPGRDVRVLRLFTDGAARGNPGPAGLGMVLEDDQGLRLWGGHSYAGTATNNKAEYLALICGLRKAAEWRPERLEVYMDSKLVVEQVSGRYKVRNPDLQPLHRQALDLLRQFPGDRRPRPSGAEPGRRRLRE